MDKLAERLRTERLTQGKSLRDLASKTKIREPYLEAIEKGRYDVLPAVYVRSFIRTIASALNIPRSEIDVLMDEVFDTDGEQPQRLPSRNVSSESAPRVSKPSFQIPSLSPSSFTNKLGSISRPLLLAYIAGAIVVLAGSYFVYKSVSSPTADTTLPDSSVVEVDGSSAISDAQLAAQDSIILTATVRDTAWLNITMDGNRSQQIIVVPGEEYRWSSMNSFVLSIGNAGAITLYRNGKELPALGKAGQVIRAVTITRKDITTSSSSFQESTRIPPAVPTPSTQQQGTRNQGRVTTSQRTNVTAQQPRSSRTSLPNTNSRAVQSRNSTNRTSARRRQAVARQLITPVPPRR